MRLDSHRLYNDDVRDSFVEEEDWDLCSLPGDLVEEDRVGVTPKAATTTTASTKITCDDGKVEAPSLAASKHGITPEESFKSALSAFTSTMLNVSGGSSEVGGGGGGLDRVAQARDAAIEAMIRYAIAQTSLTPSSPTGASLSSSSSPSWTVDRVLNLPSDSNSNHVKCVSERQLGNLIARFDALERTLQSSPSKSNKDIRHGSRTKKEKVGAPSDRGIKGGLLPVPQKEEEEEEAERRRALWSTSSFHRLSCKRWHHVQLQPESERLSLVW